LLGSVDNMPVDLKRDLDLSYSCRTTVRSCADLRLHNFTAGPAVA
jgi:hypothetical protein